VKVVVEGMEVVVKVMMRFPRKVMSALLYMVIVLDDTMQYRALLLKTGLELYSI
jgi:hypothetical protein